METVIITGGTRGIGFALANAYNDANYQVIAVDEMLHQELPSDIAFYACDFRSAKAIEDTFTQIYQDYGSSTILINNAAISYFCKPLVDVSVLEIETLLDINIRGTILCTKYFLEHHTKGSVGRIINIASTRALQNEQHVDLYGASKGAILSFTHSLAISLSNQNITVNAISPGWIHTSNEELREIDHLQHPSGRVGSFNDIIKACFYLSDLENDFVNGHNLIVDGGMTKKMIYEL